MEIQKGIEIIGLGLWLKKEKILVVSDFHLGYEEVLKKEGVFVPRFQLKDVLERLKRILKDIEPEKIVINGDLKHEFGKVLNQEWREVLKLVDFLQENCSELILVKGNHDLFLWPIARKKAVNVVEDYLAGEVFITHGDKVKDIDESVKTVIIGHEHPAISLKEKEKAEKYECFLKGKWKKKNLIVIPSLNPLTKGTDVLEKKQFSPYIDDLTNFEVYVVGKKVYSFGKIKDLITS